MSAIRETRRAFCQALRVLGDGWSGRSGRFVRADRPGKDATRDLPVRFRLAQPILQTDHVEAKLHNLRLAIDTLNRAVLQAGGIFSFWWLIGRPSAKRGFQAGRSLLGGRLAADYGGGLCQLSGIIYHTVLLTGLRILERHPHSVDIYEDAARYTPLGADATVAFGFKDLRFENTLAAPVCFRFALTTDQLLCEFCSPVAVTPREVSFVRVQETPHQRVVETRARLADVSNEAVIAISRYRVAKVAATPP